MEPDVLVFNLSFALQFSSEEDTRGKNIDLKIHSEVRAQFPFNPPLETRLDVRLNLKLDHYRIRHQNVSLSKDRYRHNTDALSLLYINYLCSMTYVPFLTRRPYT